jgi:hypothetical protein
MRLPFSKIVFGQIRDTIGFLSEKQASKAVKIPFLRITERVLEGCSDCNNSHCCSLRFTVVSGVRFSAALMWLAIALHYPQLPAATVGS